MFTWNQFRGGLDDASAEYKIDHIYSWTLDDPNPVFGANVALYSLTSPKLLEGNTIEFVLRGDQILGVACLYKDAHIVGTCDEFFEDVNEFCHPQFIHPMTNELIPQYHLSVDDAAIAMSFVRSSIDLLEGAKTRYVDEDSSENTVESNEYMVEALIKVRVESEQVGVDGDLAEAVTDAIADALMGSLESITIKSITTVEE